MKEEKILNGAYTIKEDGTLKSNYKEKTNIYNLNGYALINYKDKTYYIHRLVAQTFIPNPKNYPCVNHKDGNKLNNNVNNLEWCTYSYNNKEAYRLGLKKPSTKSSKHKSIIMLDDDKNEICLFYKMKDVDKYFGKKINNIRRAINTETKAHGYYWKDLI